MARRTEPTAPPIRAAQYLRMSTEHQRYSLEHQAVAIGRYAAFHGHEIVRTYADEGVSGLSIQKRKGLQQLLADVLAEDRGFDVILVYDVSRWGRFQNPDQSAHYEFLCTEAGVRVEYCAELFPNDGSLSSTILKGLKRVMAAEYSRELSAKVSAARVGLLQKGYWQGGPAGYGLRRQMISPTGEPGAVLEYGQGKAIHDFHTILVPGPVHEIAIVQRIYGMFVTARLSRAAIARVLNQERVCAERGGHWTSATVSQVLQNPKYLGHLISNRSTRPLGGSAKSTAVKDWIVKRNAFQAIVGQTLFEAAQRRIDAEKPVILSRNQLVEIAKRVHGEHGRLTWKLLAAQPEIRGAWAFRKGFRTLPDIYAAIGERHASLRRQHSIGQVDDSEALRRLADLFRVHGYLSFPLINAQHDLPSASTYARRFGGITKAFARVGYVQISTSDLTSRVGRARKAAAELRRRARAAQFGQSTSC
jgi:DNA invertase Pin-like site-specific DNA recombinase